LVDYEKAYSFQKDLLERRIRGEVPDTLILLEHEPVFTVGRSGSAENILLTDEERIAEDIDLREVDRGGGVTYHGPGQVVAYPVFDLNGHGKDVHRFIRSLEEVVIGVLNGYGLSARRIAGFTGVWVGEKKIASIGIGVRKWVSFHGLSLNVAPEMRHFSFINPCGLDSGKMTSMKELLERDVSIMEVQEVMIEKFGEIFELSGAGMI
jgi:lipoate-protein ligase B